MKNARQEKNIKPAHQNDTVRWTGINMCEPEKVEQVGGLPAPILCSVLES